MARTAFESLPDSQDASAPETDPYSDSFFKEPSKLSGGEAAGVPPPARQRSVTNRIRAEDLAARGIPSYRNASGDVSAVRDEGGAALTGFQQKAGIAYDSKGQPKQISYDETGPPKISDPFEKIPARTDPKTGAIEKYGPGGIYQYVGQDADVTSKVAQKASDKDLSKESSLLGRKLSLDEHDMVQGTKQQKQLHSDLTTSVPTLLDPKYHGADQEAVQKAIDEHFDAQYAAPEANKTSGFFSGELSPEAKALRADIDAKKAKAYDTSQQIFDLNDKLSGLHDNIQSGRSKERDQVETLLAHQQGGKGPLDEQQPGQDQHEDGTPKVGPAGQLYPPPEDWPRMLGGKDAVEQIHDQIRKGNIPPAAAPATVAATNDLKDAQQKAEDLKQSDPTLADKYKNVAANLLNGLNNGVGDLIKAMTSDSPFPGGSADPLNWLPKGVSNLERKAFGKSFSDVMKENADRVSSESAAMVDDRLKGTIAAKAANIIGGLTPYIATAIATKGTSIATPLMATMFYSTGYQHTLEDAKAHGASPLKAEGAATTVGVINAVLALPLKTVGAAAEAVFGDTAPKVIQRSVENAYEHGGPEAVGNLLGKLAEFIKTGGKGAEGVRKEAVDAINNIKAELSKTAGQRMATVAATTAQNAALGAGVQTAENLVKKSYNHDQGTFEGVPEQALVFGALGATSEGFRQVANARKAKQALDIINSKKRPPTPESPGGLNGPEKPTAPKGGAPEALIEGGEKSNESVSTSAKGGKGERPSSSEPARPESKVAQSDNANASGKEVAETAPAKTGEVLTTIGDAEKAFVEQGGHADKLEAQQKLAALREQFPNKADRLAAINERLAPITKSVSNGSKSVDEGAHEAATSPENGLAEPSGAQKEAGNYQKGHISVGGLDISIENPAGSKRKAHFDVLQSHYGYVKGTVGADKDHVDIFVKKGTPTDWSGPVFVVNQHNAAGKFDEHKAVIGVNTPEEAKAEYLKNYQKGWNGGKSLVGFKDPAAFKQWAESGAKGQPATLTQSDRASAAVSESSRTAPAVAGKEVSETSRTEKLVQGAMAKHASTLKALGHPLTVKPTSGDVTTQLGIGVHIERSGVAQILVDHAKLTKETAGFSEREKSRTIQRAIDEEVMHLGALKWEAKAPENTGKLKEWGATDDEIGKHLSKAYSGWEKLSDRQKGHEKVRAVLQKRWTGRLTETARAVLRELMQFFRGIYDKLTAGQKEIVNGIESILKGETKPAKAGTKLDIRADELEQRLNKTTNKAPFIAATIDASVIRTLLRSRTGAALNQAESKIEKFEEKYATTTGKQPSGEESELSRLPPRKDVRADTPEVRKSEGAKTDAGGGPVERGAASEEQKPSVGQSGQLDAKANKAVDEAFEGLFAGKPKGEPTSDEDFKNIQAPHKLGVEAGLKVPKSEIPVIERQLEQANKEMIEAAEKRSDRFQAAFGKQTYLAGKLEGAKRSGPNFEAYAQDGGNRFEIQRERKFLDEFAARNGYSSFAGLEASSPQMGKQGRAEFQESQHDRIILGAAIPQESIPVDKLPKVITAAQELIRSGIDTPQKMASVLEEKFAGKARPFSQAFWDAVGIVRPDLRGTHDWQQVYAAQTPQKKTEPGYEEYRGKGGMTKVRPIERPKNAQDLTGVVTRELSQGNAISRKQLTDLASETGISVKEVDEAAELGVVNAARQIAKEGHQAVAMKSRDQANLETYDEMVKLYENQPNLTAKTSTSKVNQAYSTPAPLAFVASQLADIYHGKSIYEPTAGNGILLIEADPVKQRVVANELSESRAEALRQQGFQPSTGNALHLEPEPVDRVIANPPFGTLLDNEGEPVHFHSVGLPPTKQIDHAIAWKALNAMTDDGRAVLILGGKNIKDPEERAQAYARQDFWKALYGQYKVVDHFTVDGDLYSKQGAGWPVDVIVISGRGKSPIQLPSAEGPRIIASWDGLRDELSRSDQDRIEAGRYDAERDREKLSGVVSELRGIAGTEQRVGPEGSAQPVDAGDGTRGSGASVTAGREESQPPAERRATETGNEVAAERAGAVGAGDVALESKQRGPLGQFRVPYKPASKAKSFGIFVPTNMEVPGREALAKLQERVGPIDDFVRAQVKLKDGSLSAEQLDALALAIDAIDGKTAFVLGDQGGVGKGRVAGAMIAWAVDHNQTPIFITKGREALCGDD
jgi:tRNA G10  N-methylase Trm11